MIHKLLYVSILIVSIHKFEVKCTANSRVKDIIYYNVDASKGFHACFRRANGTHQFGCQSELGGNIGVVHLISKENETANVKWVIEDGPHHPYTGKTEINWYVICFRVCCALKAITSGC